LSEYRRLTDVELGLLGDDELVAQIGVARDAGDFDGAKLASQVLALGFQDQIRIKVARKVPAQDVDEVAQEALISLVNASFDGKVIASFRAFLNTIVQRRVADYWKAQERHPPQDPLPHEHGGDDEIWGAEPSTEDSSAAHAIRDAVARVLARRNPLHRRIIKLYGPELVEGGEDLSGAAVVERLDADGERVSIDNVQQVWRRFKVDLETELDSGEDGGISDG
jgi:DNA-directed RNA polymerase specialized sigma24 family protein